MLATPKPPSSLRSVSMPYDDCCEICRLYAKTGTKIESLGTDLELQINLRPMMTALRRVRVEKDVVYVNIYLQFEERDSIRAIQLDDEKALELLA